MVSCRREKARVSGEAGGVRVESAVDSGKDVQVSLKIGSRGKETGLGFEPDELDSSAPDSKSYQPTMLVCPFLAFVTCSTVLL